MHIGRRQFISWGGALSLGLPLAAQAQAYPRRPVTLLVPFAPGGNIDVLARSLSIPMGKLLGQSVVVDNRAGGGGAVGTAIAAKAEADGYTVLVTTPGQLATLPRMIKTTYSSASVVPVGVASRTAMVVVARANDARFREFEQVIAMVRDKPGTLSGGHAGAGTINHLALLQLEAACGGKINPVAYRGSAPALVDLLGGQVDVVFDQIT
ncbi:MAG: tripartite tricarboxylate transporter substrate binding protein, partial [Comamonadaceae bacterium]